jgi:hypothetical protein
MCNPSGRPGRSRPYALVFLRTIANACPACGRQAFLHPCPRLCPLRQRGGATPSTPSRLADPPRRGKEPSPRPSVSLSHLAGRPAGYRDDQRVRGRALACRTRGWSRPGMTVARRRPIRRHVGSGAARGAPRSPAPAVHGSELGPAVAGNLQAGSPERGHAPRSRARPGRPARSTETRRSSCDLCQSALPRLAQAGRWR